MTEPAMKQGPTAPSTTRQLRVFISSTFRDMHAERDHLVKFIFPQLRKLCEMRGVTWGEVDLRWGIPDEAKAEGKVLSICLEEIERCRPYFIGMLGERYGWIPEAFPPEVIEREPWLLEHARGEKSVTELEILHGVLRKAAMKGHAYFYFRDPGYLERLPVGCVPDDYRSESPQAAAKLTHLKQTIRQARDENVCSLRENYHDAQQLGEWLLDDVTQLINRLFPEGSQPDPLRREALDHEAYARSREQVYIGRAEYYERLDEHASGAGDQPLVILGKSGSGKSALLANWAGRYRRAHPEAIIFEHYIGATPASADWAAMLRRILGEFKRQLGLEQDIPNNTNDLRNAFSNWLHMAATKGRVVLILDALNQLEDREGAPELQWLPVTLPPNVRMILSTLPGRPLDAINKRGWPTFEIQPLDVVERKRLIGQFLAQYTKLLEPAQVARIAEAEQAELPLYLRALLDELRQFGMRERLDDQISHYLTAPTVTELFDRILRRYEEDFELDRPGLVGDAMALLWAARNGLTEAELLDLLGTTSQPMPRAAWSPLYLAAESALVNHAGLLGFVHIYLRDAVGRRYLASGKQQRGVHLRLARYFEDRSLGERKVEELPYQFQHAEEWERLARLLWDLDFLAYTWEHGHDRDLVGYWTSLRGRFTPASGYEAAVNGLEGKGGTPQQIVQHCRRIGWLLDRMAFFADARKFFERAAKANEACSGAESSETAMDWRWIGLIYYEEGKFEEALKLLKRALVTLERNHGHETGIVADLLSDIGLAYWESGSYTEAQAYAERSLLLREKLLGSEHQDVALSLNNLASIYHVQDLYTKALPLYERALAIREKVLSPEDTDVSQTRNNLGSLYFYMGRYQESLDHCLRALRIFEQAYGPFHPYVGSICNNIAITYQKMGKMQEAEKWMRRVLEIDEVTLGPEHPEVATHLSNLGSIYSDQQRWQEGLPLLQRALKIAEHVFGAHHHHSSHIAKELAVTSIKSGDLKSAEALLQRARVDLEAAFGKSHPTLANTLFWLGILFERKKDRTRAQDYYQQAIAMADHLLGPEHPTTKNYRQQFDEFRKLKS
jgi:nephrocystin-3